MSNVFNNFLGSVVNGTFGDSAIMRDYQHADRLYVKNGYINAPKFGFIFYVEFNINPGTYDDPAWETRYKDCLGMLVKRVDLPRFSISSDTLNQYNRKTVIQTGIKYNNINFEFHDDSGNLTQNLWRNYYQYYYQDTLKKSKSNADKNKFNNTKYSINSYDYGLNGNQTVPFFSSIDVYILYHHQYTKFSLVNPLITDWSHDTLDQSTGDKVLSNKMTVAYESVNYDWGSNTVEPKNFNKMFYDKTPSPLSVGGNGSSTIFGQFGILSGASDVLGTLGQGNILGAAIKGVTLAKNISKINKASLKSEGTNIINSALGNLSVTGNQPGGVGTAIQSGLQKAKPSDLTGR